MDRSKWEKIITNFQACARGYLVRHEVRRAREDFEEIVTEIDGGLTHLRWTETAISTPLFTYVDDPLLTPASSTGKPPEPEPDPDPDVCAVPSSAPSSEEAADHMVLLERTEAERDDPQIRSPIHPVRGGEEGPQISGGTDGRVMKGTDRSPTIWSSVEPHIHAYSPEGPPRQYRSAQDVPRTPEDLRLHRNTLTMELVWLQQAIDSRKKYLTLKNRLSVS
ncbi:IQ domain-containing protein C [Kryptolebias marmoratus]|uniref:IQ domain-containing protein C n=1 Tax=Kryptolebias marmoratus TaxID=37003 RepID=UPI0007F8E12D|nr:IQ domain-containing protein C [Kryptolebias marmoratus]